jgi:hypothetical protein
LSYFTDSTKATQFRNDFLFPFAGYRDYDSASSIRAQGSDDHYWSSSPVNTNARGLYLGSSNVDAYSSYSRAFGFPVRCFANEQPTFATVSYSTTEQTYNAVTATISFNTTGITLTDATGRMPTNAEGENNMWQKTFSENATEILTRTDSNGKTGTVTVTIDQIHPIVYGYANTGMYTFTAPQEGNYVIELRGAGADGVTSTMGKGAYTKGKLSLAKGETIYIYVGENAGHKVGGTAFNGGFSDNGGRPGGGATDVRLVSGAWDEALSLNARIMVAAGAGATNGGTAGAGGTLKGVNGGGTNGATQISASASSNTAYAGGGFGYGGK